MCTKTCTRCGNTYDITMFEQKQVRASGHIKRRGYCRLCQKGVAYTHYTWATKEQQQQAQENCKQINQLIKNLLRSRSCHHCNTPLTVGSYKRLCDECKVISVNTSKCKKEKKHEEKRKAKGYYTIRSRKRVEVLSNTYVKSLIKNSIRSTCSTSISHHDIPPDLVILKRNQLSLTRQLKEAKVCMDQGYALTPAVS